MQCPQCGSENVYETGHRGLEKLVGVFSSQKPFQCRECWARFMKKSGTDAKGKKSSRLYIVIFLVLMISLLWYKYVRDPEPDVRVAGAPQPKPVQTLSKPASTEPDPVYHATDAATSSVQETSDISDSAGLLSAQEQSESELSEPSASSADSSVLTHEKSGDTLSAAETPADSAQESIASDSATEDIAKRPEPATRKTEASMDGKPDVQTRQSVPGKPHVINRIVTEQTDGELRLSVSSDQRITKYKRFYMHEPPPRLVLNIYGEWRYAGPGEIDIQSDMVHKIRIGRHHDYLSIVLDLNLKEPIDPKIMISDDGLVLSVKKAG
jgi:hypothetical protein